MFKLAGIGRGRKPEEGSAEAGNETSAPAPPRRQPGEIRLQTELVDLEMPPQCEIVFPKTEDLMNFNVTIKPDEGYWKGGKFVFVFNVKPMYPHDAPKVLCKTRVYHPNIDKEGHVCLNILREDWKPILSISSVVYGLLHLFLDPNPNDPLNKEAAEELRKDASNFKRIVERSMRGYMDGYDRLL
jgi:ubiquitin-conjugating enzyme E2 M